MRNPIKKTVCALMLIAAATMSGTWCEVDCPEGDSYVEIENCPPGLVQDGYKMVEAVKYECTDVDTCTGSHIMVCVECVTTTYTVAEPNCVFRIDIPETPNPFPDDYSG